MTAVVALLALALSVLLPVRAGYEAALSGPEQVGRSYLAALEVGDIDRAWSFFDAASQTKITRTKFDAALKSRSKTGTLRIDKITLADPNKAQFEYSRVPLEGADSYLRETQFTLAKTAGGDWRISQSIIPL